MYGDGVPHPEDAIPLAELWALVLGDAEQVGACSFMSGTGAVEVGSIDEPEIQKAIVAIMEGGYEAFARRKEIYQLWKQ